MNLIFLGPPGAGKGTMASLAKDFYNIPHISTGDLFRAAISNETALGKQVKAILAAGDLVPDEVTIAMVQERLLEGDTDRGYILDGFPRTIGQAESLDKFADIDHAVNFNIPREMIVKRLTGRRVAKRSGKLYHIIYNPPKVEGVCDVTGEPLIQREDDKEEAILNRLDVYDEQTAPLIAYYRKQGKLVDIDSSLSTDEVFKQLLRSLA
ncbi:MAG: adenylate kinase [Spirochaetia bacterium]|nr:adenylate kinase [Spirochaetia bacterium]